MAETITIIEQDRIEAENILEQFLTDRMPEQDFTKGGALRDFVVVALANIFAYLRAERDLVRARQSLLLLGRLTGTSADDAVDEILSNWFIRRKTGQVASGSVTVTLSRAVDVEIATTTKFYKTSSLLYYPDTLENTFYSADDLLPVIDSSGAVAAYTFSVPVYASQAGTQYNVTPGVFADYTRFSPYVTRVENTADITGGGGNETTEEMLVRSETAITVRDLNSSRSIDATLKDEFVNVDDVIVVGYGDTEMIRDLIAVEITNTRIHSGGHVDAYLRMPILANQTVESIVGGVFTDPREGYYILRDPTIFNEGDPGGGIPATDFTSFGVTVGDILVFSNAVENYEANSFIIKEVTPYGLYVAKRTPFPKAMPVIEATYNDGSLENVGALNTLTSANNEHTFADSYYYQGGDKGKYVRIVSSGEPRYNLGTGRIVFVDTVLNRVTLEGLPYDFVLETDVEWELLTRQVSYTVGGNSPTYNDNISEGPNTGMLGTPRHSGEFTKTVQYDGRVMLPFHPVYRITDVSFPGGSFPPALIDTDGRVRFSNRVNVEPVEAFTASELQYQVIGHNPGEVPSGWQMLELDIGWATDKTYFNGQTLRVTYDTLSGYDAVWTFMLGTSRRILCGSVIPKGLHPVYLTLDIRYRPSKIATVALDTTAAAAALAVHVNEFNVIEDLDMSDIFSFLRTNYPEIGFLEPAPIYYQLLAPDGRVLYFKTDDAVTMDPAKIIDPRYGVLPDPTDPTADQYRMDVPEGLGVSDNTVRYLTVVDLITFTNLEG